MTPAHQLFRRTFGFTPPRAVRAPGRIELLGNHTDYNEGLVLALAVNREITMAVSPRPDHTIELVSDRYPGKSSHAITRLAASEDGAWTNYVLGVLDQLQAHGVPLRGFNAAVSSTLPPGAGLASSAALEVATALAYRELYPYQLTEHGASAPPQRDNQGVLPPLTKPDRLNLARLCRDAENRFIGLQCGLLDPVASLFGKSFHAVEIDCQSESVERLILDPGTAFVIADSGVTHQLVDDDYNLRRATCAAAARALGLKSLRALDPSRLEAGLDRLTSEEADCARHVMEENRRVMYGTRALHAGDVEQLGQFLFQSHASSRDLFRNSCRELDILVALAEHHEACLGARLTGGGFGGATLHLVREPDVDDYIAYLSRAYEQATGIATTPARCLVVDGASPLT